MKKIVRITRKEMEYLIAHGIGYHENGIMSTTGHSRSWYMTESRQCKRLLKEYREKIIVK